MFMRLLKFNYNHWPAGAEGGRGGQFAPRGVEGAQEEQPPKVAQNLADRFNKRVTPEEVLARYSPEQRAELARHYADQSRKLQEGLATSKRYTINGEGKRYTAERKAVQRAVLDNFITRMEAFRAKPGEAPLLTVLGGRGGSGKSSLNGRGYNEEGSPKQFVLDSDAIKEALARQESKSNEHPNGVWNGKDAPLYHEESDRLFDTLVAYARRNRINLVLDMTLKNDKSAKIASFKRDGYDIKGAYMYLPPGEAAYRAGLRGVKPGGRLVSSDVIVGSVKNGVHSGGNYNNEKNFDRLIKFFNKGYSVYENMGKEPHLVTDTRKHSHRKCETFRQVLKFNPNHAPAGSPEGGQFTSGDGQGVEFVSPSVTEGMNLHGAIEALRGARHADVTQAAGEVDGLLGLHSKHVSAVGTWSDGAEDSILGRVYGNPTYDQVRLSAAMKGMLADQKAVIPFKVDRNGKDSLYKIKVAGSDLSKIHNDMLSSGLEFHTLVPHNDHTDVYVFDPGTELTQKVQEAGAKHGLEISQWRGQGEFLGSWDSREEGRSAYQAVIDAHLGQDRRGAWDRLYSRWRQTHPVVKGQRFLSVLRSALTVSNNRDMMVA